MNKGKCNSTTIADSLPSAGRVRVSTDTDITALAPTWGAAAGSQKNCAEIENQAARQAGQRHLQIVQQQIVELITALQESKITAKLPQSLLDAAGLPKQEEYTTQQFLTVKFGGAEESLSFEQLESRVRARAQYTGIEPQLRQTLETAWENSRAALLAAEREVEAQHLALWIRELPRVECRKLDAKLLFSRKLFDFENPGFIAGYPEKTLPLVRIFGQRVASIQAIAAAVASFAQRSDRPKELRTAVAEAWGREESRLEQAVHREFNSPTGREFLIKGLWNLVIEEVERGYAEDPRQARSERLERQLRDLHPDLVCWEVLQATPQAKYIEGYRMLREGLHRALLPTLTAYQAEEAEQAAQGQQGNQRERAISNALGDFEERAAHCLRTLEEKLFRSRVEIRMAVRRDAAEQLTAARITKPPLPGFGAPQQSGKAQLAIEFFAGCDPNTINQRSSALSYTAAREVAELAMFELRYPDAAFVGENRNELEAMTVRRHLDLPDAVVKMREQLSAALKLAYQDGLTFVFNREVATADESLDQSPLGRVGESIRAFCRAVLLLLNVSRHPAEQLAWMIRFRGALECLAEDQGGATNMVTRKELTDTRKVLAEKLAETYAKWPLLYSDDVNLFARLCQDAFRAAAQNQGLAAFGIFKNRST